MTETKTKVAAAPAPGSPDFDVDNAPQEEYDKHIAILKRRADVAALTASPLTTVSATTEQAAVNAGPVQSVPMEAKHDSLTGQVQELPAKVFGLLSEEDKARFTAADAPKPADLPQA
ncbi:hypothetical protein [Hymenobacter properus]|uniref:Uncharacterized protein n=1 Tax=Hymenobacter properus TaxID=2791026 RepID=A0A931BIJ7_9BACT|nr:hypothetical protein [Hymenobacter properus]MBF9140838.1 hypothetical protein [Hymenobacter properus]MBR7719647.1 hypothetical protein [Microvirga sp. SRT04]